MMHKISVFFRGKKHRDDFSAFFRDTKSGEKKKFIKEVIRESNKDQRDLVERHKQMLTKSA